MHACVHVRTAQQLKTHLFCVSFKLSSSLVRRARATLTKTSRPAHQTTVTSKKHVLRMAFSFFVCMHGYIQASLQLKMYIQMTYALCRLNVAIT